VPRQLDGQVQADYLRTLTSSNGDDRCDVIVSVFKGVDRILKSCKKRDELFGQFSLAVI
jgi:hypothetical protein